MVYPEPVKYQSGKMVLSQILYMYQHSVSFILKAGDERKRNMRDDPDKTTYTSAFKQPPPSPYKHYHQTPPSPANRGFANRQAPPSPGARRIDDIGIPHQVPPSPATRAFAREVPPSPRQRKIEDARLAQLPPLSPPGRGGQQYADWVQQTTKAFQSRGMDDTKMAYQSAFSPNKRDYSTEQGPQSRQIQSPQTQQQIQSTNARPEYSQFNGQTSEQGENEDYQPRIDDFSTLNPASYHQQMTAAYPKANSAPPDNQSLPATPSKLSLPLGQYDDMRPFIIKQRNREYNSLKDKVLKILLERTMFCG